MRGREWAAPAIALSLTYLTGCAAVVSDPIIATPELHQYSQEFQMKLLSELEVNPGNPCDRLEPTEQCSAWKRALADYLELRDDVRAAQP